MQRSPMIELLSFLNLIFISMSDVIYEAEIALCNNNKYALQLNRW
jgi:hypothetical protein